MSTVRTTVTLAAVGLGLAVLEHLTGGTVVRRRKKQLSGMEIDEPDEEPPPDIVYDNRPPCHVITPEHPWSVEPSTTPIFLPMPAAEDEEGEYCIPPAALEPKKRTSRKMAEGGPRPQWPIRTKDEDKVKVSYQDVQDLWHGKWGRHFGSGRKGHDGIRRFHAGVDLFADDGDVVQAMEDGRIIAILPFHHGSYAIYVLHDSGIIVNYGEVEKNSWWDYGIESGVGTMQKVQAGQPLAKIGTMTKGSSMLHLETFTGDTEAKDIRQGEMRWVENEPAPENLLDPTRYLVRAQRVWFEDKMGSA